MTTEGPYADVETGAEALVVLHALHGDDGLDAVRALLDAARADGELDRSYLRGVVADLRRVGLDQIAGVVAGYAKIAKAGPLTFEERLAARLRAKRRAARKEAKTAAPND
jgi:uncharacterized membrane protein YebE (DUF533 family)